MLDQIKIASPCSANWELMTGDDQVRFCSHCEKHVYNLSAMTRRAAETLIRETEGHVCTRFYRRADGTILTQDCPVGLRARADRVRRRVEVAMAGIMGLAGVATAQSQTNPAAQVAQAERAEISGVVKDATGAVIPNASITLSTDKDGVVAVGHSSSDGVFRLTATRSATINLKVEVAGFKTFEKKGIVVDSKLNIEIQMDVGAVTMGATVALEKRSLLDRLFRH